MKISQIKEEKQNLENFLLNIIPKPIFIVTSDGNVSNINSHFETYFKISKDDIINKPLKHLKGKNLKKLSELIEQDLMKMRKIGITGIKRSSELTFRDENFKNRKIIITKSFLMNNENRISGLIGIIEDVSEQEKRMNELMKKAIIDELTECYNRRYFNISLNEHIQKSKRYKMPLSLIIFDIDFFKKINDTYGHQVGDYVLKELSQIIKRNIRATDLIFRIGGEEFAILLPNTEIESAVSVAEKLRKMVENYKFKHVNRVTISMGVAKFDENDDFESFYKKCDEALYRAKETGRNKVVFAK